MTNLYSPFFLCVCYYHVDNSMQMTKVCPHCVSICDLCQNNLYWRQDSTLGVKDVPLVKGRASLL